MRLADQSRSTGGDNYSMPSYSLRLVFFGEYDMGYFRSGLVCDRGTVPGIYSECR